MFKSSHIGLTDTTLLNCLPQSGQLRAWLLIWCCSKASVWNPLSQDVHLKLGSTCIFCLWTIRLSFLLKTLSHISHEWMCGFSLCSFICLTKQSFLEKYMSHFVHLYSSWFILQDLYYVVCCKFPWSCFWRGLEMAYIHRWGRKISVLS